MSGDWIVTEVKPTAEALAGSAHYKLHVTVRSEYWTGEKYWTVPDVDCSRYDLSNAKIDPRALPFIKRDLAQ